MNRISTVIVLALLLGAAAALADLHSILSFRDTVYSGEVLTRFLSGTALYGTIIALIFGVLDLAGRLPLLRRLRGTGFERTLAFVLCGAVGAAFVSVYLLRRVEVYTEGRGQMDELIQTLAACIVLPFLFTIFAPLLGFFFRILRIEAILNRTAAWPLLVLFVLVLAGGSVALLQAHAHEKPPAAAVDRPNVLLIVIDTLRADHLSTYGYELTTDPEIAKVAAAGTTFLNPVSAAPYTTASVASIMTAMYPPKHGAQGYYPLHSDNQTLAEVYRDSGYRTAAFVENKLLTSQQKFDQGYSTYGFVDNQFLILRYLSLLFPSLGLYPSDEESTTSLALNWIESDNERPFFLWVHYLAPHFVYEAPESHQEPFIDGLPGRQEYEDMVRGVRKGDVTNFELFFNPPIEEDCVKWAIAQYDAEISAVDAEIGRLLNRLEELGVADSTIVAITSDHGESLGEHGLYFSHSYFLFSATERVPLVIRWPGKIPADMRIESPVRTVDLYPSLLELSGLPLPEGDLADGTSFLPLIAGEETEAREAYAESAGVGPRIMKQARRRLPGPAGRWRMFQNEKWKLIFIPGGPELSFLLYDMENDPEETQDLADVYPEVVKELKRKLFRKMDELKENRRRKDDSAAPLDPTHRDRLQALGYVR